MEQTENNGIQPTPNPKRRVLFLLGIIVGILLGVGITMLIVNHLNSLHPKEIQLVHPTEQVGKSDTVVKYIIHKHEAMYSENPAQAIDTAAIDTLQETELSQDYMLDEDDLLALEREEDENAVPTEKLIARSFVKVTFLDNDKNPISTPDNVVANMQLQQWETPIKNKITYQFSGNTIRIKGASIAQFKVIHYKKTYYLSTAKSCYPIRRNNQFERLIESADLRLQ